ncbi:MAG: hypothetical protein IJ812_07665 [Schwartzia sp.]|nr:hypothetical protein [Schwartzia sp. (in: firmicutes)]MBR1886271.1 hypothetical protein [Schwartzia sp. (in: firmicutes)]
MKIWKKTAAALAILAAFHTPAIYAAETRTVLGIEVKNPSCVLMKFTDDTRYQLIDADETLSDLVLEKMLASNQFNLKETRPIDQNIENMLYDEKMRELAGAREAMDYGDYDALFEGPGFSESKAQSIASASVGQIVTPSITSSIGNAHQAEYLIQGTIINIGNGAWLDAETKGISDVSSRFADALAKAAQNRTIQMTGGLFGAGMALSILGSLSTKKTSIGVQCDMRVIKASTGEVVWSKRVTATGDQVQTKVAGLTFGSAKLNANLYAKAIDNAAQEIVNVLIADMNKNWLFAK